MRQFCFYALLGMVGIAVSGHAHGQLRIVDYNIAGLPNSSALTTVLNAIKDEAINGISKPIDVLILNEVDSPDITTILGILNNQGVGTYLAGNLGSTTGAGSVGLVYRSNTVFLVTQQQVVNTSSNGAARGVMRYTLRPQGYSPQADFYIYGSHYKASDTTSDANRRNLEATAIRANSDALGDGAHVIYAGDFNIYRSSEPMWATLTGAGNGQAFDPVNQVGNWHDNSSFKAWHTQNPAGSGFVGGGMDDRFDWQMITGELQDNEGMSIIPGSYHAFGNNGTHAINSHINTGSGASSSVLNALGSASDHLPVVAQYQVPAKMEVVYAPVPSRVMIGAAFNASVTVSNSAGDGVLVVDAVGADELNYTLTGSGGANGTQTGSEAAFGGSNTHLFPLNTSTAGTKHSSIATEKTSPQSPSPDNINLFWYDVLDHANPSFASSTNLNSITYDFGTVTLGAPSPFFDYEIANLLSTAGFTSKLEFDGFNNTGDSSAFDVGIELGETPLNAGMQRTYTTSFVTDTLGSFSATIQLLFSDEDVIGEEMYSLSMTLTGAVVDNVATGDFDGDGDVDGRDFLAWQRGESPNMLSSDDLELWQQGYNSPPLATSVSVPEPTTTEILLMVVAGICMRAPIKVFRASFTSRKYFH